MRSEDNFPYSMDYYDQVLAEIYDQCNTEVEEIQLLLNILDTPPKRILEVFSGAGRISIPLTKAGHHVTCIETAPAMNHRHLEKLRFLVS